MILLVQQKIKLVGFHWEKIVTLMKHQQRELLTYSIASFKHVSVHRITLVSICTLKVKSSSLDGNTSELLTTYYVVGYTVNNVFQVIV